jgi:hypothetical protein
VGPPLCIAALIFRRGVFMTRKWIAIFVILSLVGINYSGCTSQSSAPVMLPMIEYPAEKVGNITVKPTTLNNSAKEHLLKSVISVDIAM